MKNDISSSADKDYLSKDFYIFQLLFILKIMII